MKAFNGLKKKQEKVLVQARVEKSLHKRFSKKLKNDGARVSDFLEAAIFLYLKEG